MICSFTSFATMMPYSYFIKHQVTMVALGSRVDGISNLFSKRTSHALRCLCRNLWYDIKDFSGWLCVIYNTYHLKLGLPLYAEIYSYRFKHCLTPSRKYCFSNETNISVNIKRGYFSPVQVKLPGELLINDPCLVTGASLKHPTRLMPSATTSGILV